MSGPRMTPLMVAPSDAPDLVGKVIMSSELIRTLIALNPRLFCPDVDDRNHIEGWHGVTSLWIGTPDGGGRPICGIRLGPVPEWTEIDEQGILRRKGWRAIFDKVIRSGAVRRESIERAFGVTLGAGERDRGLCPKCVREGRRGQTNGGARGYCDTHDDAYSAAERARATAPEIAERLKWRKEKIYVT